MLKNKIYDYVKDYLDMYLYGFDPSQIEMSILKGNYLLLSYSKETSILKMWISNQTWRTNS